MFDIQNNYIEEIDKLIEVFDEAELDVSKIGSLRQFIDSQELLIPVVGEFSAGKSTLLNSFIDDSKIHLPTSVAPETAIATELRFSTDERIEAIDKNGKVVKVYGTNDFEEINKHSKEYSFLKLYVNNQNIRSIEPLILVDMPGFESPLDAHNDAIRKYLNRGSHFIVLVSATDGTLKATSMRHLNDILEFERDFSVVLSKSNLVEPSNLESVIEKVKDDVDLNFGLEKEIIPIDMDGSLAIKNIISNLNPENLFKNIVSPTMKDVLYQLESSVNMKIAAFNKDTSENDEIIEKLKKSVEKIKKEEDRLRKTSKSNYSSQYTYSIVSNVGKELSNSADSLVEIGMTNGALALQTEIQDLINSLLIPNIKNCVKSISEDINSRFSSELTELDSAVNAYCGEGEFIKNVTNNISSLFDNKSTYAIRENENTTEIVDKSEILPVYEDEIKPVSNSFSIFSFIGNILGNLMDAFLPGLRNIIFGQSESQQKLDEEQRKIEEERQREIEKNREAERQRLIAREREDARNRLNASILTSIIPEIKRSLSNYIPSILEENVERIITEISAQYESLINGKQKEIEQVESERQQKAMEINAFIEKLQKAKEEVLELCKKVFA